MPGCPTEGQLVAYGNNMADSDTARGISSHVALCERCAKWLAEARDDDALLARMRGALGGDGPQASDASRSAQEGGLPKIEGYALLGELGRGGMGIVYRAVQTALGREVALKILPANVSALKRDSIDRFRREAAAAGKLHHRSIIPIFDFGTSKGLYYYAMELIDGRPLDEVIECVAAQPESIQSAGALSQLLFEAPLKAQSSAHSEAKPGSSSSIRGRFYFQQVAQWIAEVADALDYAHGKGVVHRDIKPGNLILSRDSRLMLGDFGLAKVADEASVTMTGSLLGTVRYLSPEQAMAGRIDVDHRTDIYSLGATMYELLCFRQAFPGAEQSQVLQAIIAREPKAPRKVLPQVPAELETICLKTLEKDPAARYSTARELADDLRRFWNDLPIIARRPGPIRRAKKFVRRHKVSTLATLLATLLLYSTAAYLYERQERIATDVENLTQQATNYGAEKKWERAAYSYELARQLGGDTWELVYAYACMTKEHYNESKNPELLQRMDTLCEKALRLAPEQELLWNYKGTYLKLLADYHKGQGDNQEAQKLYDDARQWFTKAINKDPLARSALHNRAICLALTGDFHLALDDTQRAAELKAEYPEYQCDSLRQLAMIHLALGDTLAATENALKARQCSLPIKRVGSRLGEALLVLARAQLDLALAQLDGEVHIDTAPVRDVANPDFSSQTPPIEQHKNSGVAAVRIATIINGALDSTERPTVGRDLIGDAEYHARAASDTGDQVLPHKIKSTQARIALALGKPEDAIHFAEEALRLDDDLPSLDHLIIASAHGAAGRYDAASSAFDEAIRLWPAELEQRRYLVSARSGVLWIDRAEDLERLRGEVERLLQSAVN